MVGRVISNKSGISKPFEISRAVFDALSPLDKAAARALEICGKVRIIKESEKGKDERTSRKLPLPKGEEEAGPKGEERETVAVPVSKVTKVRESR